VPGTFTVRGCPAAADGLDGELARLQDQGAGGMAPLATPPARLWTYGAVFVRTVTGFDASPAVEVPVATTAV